jgi:hypothetical protein
MFRETFKHLEKIGLLDMELSIHRLCLFLVYQPRIQRSLDETVTSWNFHKIRTAGNKTPAAIYQLSREKAINRGYWTGDPGDDVQIASDPSYGHDPQVPLPPLDELAGDPTHVDEGEFLDTEAEREAGLFVNGDDEIEEAREILQNFDFTQDNGNWGIDVYCQAVMLVTAYFASQTE